MKKLNDSNNKEYIDVEYKEINDKDNKKKKVKAKIVKEKGYKRKKLKKAIDNTVEGYTFYKSLPKGFRKFINCTIIVTVVGGTITFTINKLQNENARLVQQNQILAAQQDENENARILAEQEIMNKFEQIKKDSIEITIEHKSTISSDNKENKPLEFIYTKTFENDLWGIFDTEITLPYRANAECELKADLSDFEYSDFDFKKGKLKLGVNEDKIYLVNYNTTKDKPIYMRMVGDPIKFSKEEIKERGLKEVNLAAKIDSSSEKEMLKNYRNKFEEHYTNELLKELNSNEEEQKRLKNLVIDKIKSVYEVLGLKVEVEIIKNI